MTAWELEKTTKGSKAILDKCRGRDTPARTQARKTLRKVTHSACEKKYGKDKESADLMKDIIDFAYVVRLKHYLDAIGVSKTDMKEFERNCG